MGAFCQNDEWINKKTLWKQYLEGMIIQGEMKKVIHKSSMGTRTERHRFHNAWITLNKKDTWLVSRIPFSVKKFFNFSILHKTYIHVRLKRYLLIKMGRAESS